MNNNSAIMNGANDIENQHSNNHLFSKNNNNGFFRKAPIYICAAFFIGLVVTGIVFISHHENEHDHHDQDHDH
jgi:hypothetical protein